MVSTAASSHAFGMSGWKGGSPAARAAMASHVSARTHTVLFTLAPVSQTQLLAAWPCFVRMVPLPRWGTVRRVLIRVLSRRAAHEVGLLRNYARSPTLGSVLSLICASSLSR